MNEQELSNIRQELVGKETSAIANRESYDAFLNTSGFSHLVTNGFHPDVLPTALPVGAKLNLTGMSVAKALIAFANANARVVTCGPCAEAFQEFGVGNYKSKQAAYSSFYNLLTNKNQWTKIAPGMFRLNEVRIDGRTKRPLVTPSITKQPEVSRTFRQLAALAVGRDHSICDLPANFRNFPLKSLHGLSYKDAAIAVARHNGGTINTQEIGKVFWHADLCGRAKSPSTIAAYIWTSAFSPAAGAFETVGLGTYKLIV